MRLRTRAPSLARPIIYRYPKFRDLSLGRRISSVLVGVLVAPLLVGLATGLVVFEIQKGNPSGAAVELNAIAASRADRGEGIGG